MPGSYVDARVRTPHHIRVQTFRANQAAHTVHTRGDASYPIRLPKGLRRAHRHPSPATRIRHPALGPTLHSKPRRKCAKSARTQIGGEAPKCAKSAPTRRGEQSWGPLCTVNRDASAQSRPERRWEETRKCAKSAPTRRKGRREEGREGNTQPDRRTGPTTRIHTPRTHAVNSGS